jgi:hypothetical protein
MVKTIIKKEKVTIDTLAVMVAKGFEHMDEKMEQKFKSVDRQFDDVKRDLDLLYTKVNGIDQKYARRFDLVEDNMRIVKTAFEKYTKTKLPR